MALRRIGFVILTIATLISVLPLLSVLVAGLTASHLGCALDEGSVHPCLLFGRDIGEALYTMAVAGWLMLLTLPAFAVLLLVWLIVGIVALAKRRRRVSPEG